MHGFAYAFFFATVYIFVDENFPKDVRTSAQSLFNLLILGLGPFVGGFLWKGLEAVIHKNGRRTEHIDYTSLFLVPSGSDWSLPQSWRSSSIPKRRIRFPNRFPFLSIKIFDPDFSVQGASSRLMLVACLLPVPLLLAAAIAAAARGRSADASSSGI